MGSQPIRTKIKLPRPYPERLFSPLMHRIRLLVAETGADIRVEIAYPEATANGRKAKEISHEAELLLTFIIPTCDESQLINFLKKEQILV